MCMCLSVSHMISSNAGLNHAVWMCWIVCVCVWLKFSFVFCFFIFIYLTFFLPLDFCVALEREPNDIASLYRRTFSSFISQAKMCVKYF